MAAAKAAMGFRHPIVGMHVRRGDSCRLKASPGYPMPLAACKGVSDYAPHLARLRDLYGVTTVFVTSDSPSVYAELHAWAAARAADRLSEVSCRATSTMGPGERRRPLSN